MRPASFGAVSRPSAAITRSGTKEIAMREYSMSELLNLTRPELFRLQAKLLTELSSLDDEELAMARENLRRIRCILMYPRYVP